MIARYNNISLVFGIPGILLQIFGGVWRDSPERETLGSVMVLAGTLLLMIGWEYYDNAKGRSPPWSIIEFLSRVSLIVLACLKVRAPNQSKRLSSVNAPQ
jgi:hypothetical protein